MTGTSALAAPAPTESRARRYLFIAALVLLVLLVGAGAGYQWSRPLPHAAFRSNGATSIRLAGTSPSLPWPTTGSAALTMEGVGSLGQVGVDKPVPIASITKVMTAYVVLKDHPLTAGAAGPSIPVTADIVAAYQAGLATQQSVVAVAAGESLTEIEALEGLLIPSGNNIATLLAEWDAGSDAAFVAKMNTTAKTLGLDSTHFNDVSGLDPGSTSTAADLIRLGQAAMALPAFAHVVGMGQATLPVAGLLYNFDYDLGHNGIVGIKTGTDEAAGGCFLFEAQQMVDGKKVTIVGAVLGQQTSSPITAVLNAAETLAQAAFAGMTTVPIVTATHVVGTVTAPWGGSVAVHAPQAPRIVGWPGLALPAQSVVRPLSSAISPGTGIGFLKVDLDGHNVPLALHATRALAGPSFIWRLTRL